LNFWAGKADRFFFFSVLLSFNIVNSRHVFQAAIKQRGMHAKTQREECHSESSLFITVHQWQIFQYFFRVLRVFRGKKIPVLILVAAMLL